MPFAYYERLTQRQQRIYRRSDGIPAIPVPHPAELEPKVAALRVAIEDEDRLGVEMAAENLLYALAGALRVPPLRVQVLAVRPSRNSGELYGLYHGADGGQPARVTVWMRTAQRHQPVKFRTFLRTLLHELCHHLDYTLLRLPDSFHTDGFYRRESSLLRQLLPREMLRTASVADG
jgi:hypothetical protein